MDISNIVNAVPQIYGNLGICHAQLGRKSEALAAFDKALEPDSQYELAMVNKAMTETLAEGEKLDNKVKTVEYYKDFPMQNRSYAQYFLDQALQVSDIKGRMPVPHNSALSSASSNLTRLFLWIILIIYCSLGIIRQY